MSRSVVAGTVAALLLTGAAHAETAYTWTGYGINNGASTKCATYKMTIDVAVEGDKVKGLFQQEGRTQRHFEATLDKDGLIKTKAVVGNNNTMEVTGQIRDGASKIKLDGYCLFEGPLAKK